MCGGNDKYEENLSTNQEWGTYLRGKMVHTLDGNNRHAAFMSCIAEGKHTCLFVVIWAYFILVILLNLSYHVYLIYHVAAQQSGVSKHYSVFRS